MYLFKIKILSIFIRDFYDSESWIDFPIGIFQIYK